MALQLLDLDQLGVRITLVDKALVELLGQRVRLMLLVEEWKRKYKQPITRPEVERKRVEEVREWATRQGLNPEFVHSLWYSIIGEANKVQMMQFQASQGIYSDEGNQADWEKKLKENLLQFTAKCVSAYDAQYERDFFGTRLHAEFETEEISQLAQETENTRAIDLGCATGRHSLLIVPHFESVVGYDISPEMIEVAREKTAVLGAKNVSFHVHDLEEKIPEQDESVSLVIMSMGTASDMPNVRVLLREIRRVLKHGGKAFLSFYNREALRYQWGFIPWPVGLVAQINMQRNCLDVTWREGGIEKVYSLYARLFGPSEIENLFPPGLPVIKILTHPVVASLMPDTLYDSEGIQESVKDIDRRLTEEGVEGGAYLTVIARKT